MSYKSPCGGARCPCLTIKKGTVCPCLRKGSGPKPTTSSARSNSSVSTIGSQNAGPLREVKQTIDRIRRELASHSNNIKSVRQLPDSFARVLSHSEKSTIHKQSYNSTATKLEKSSASTLPRILNSPVSKKNVSSSKISVNHTTIIKNKNKSTQSSTKFSKTDPSSSTKISHNSTSISKSIDISSTSKTLCDNDSFLKEQSRKQANPSVENSIRLFRSENLNLTDISLKTPHIISRSKSLSPGYKGSSNKEEVTHNQHGKLSVSSLEVHSHNFSTSKNHSKSASNLSTENNNIPIQRKSKVTFTLNINFEDINSGQNAATFSIRGNFNGNTGN